MIDHTNKEKYVDPKEALPMFYPRHTWRSFNAEQKKVVLWGSAVAILILSPLPWIIYYLFLR